MCFSALIVGFLLSHLPQNPPPSVERPALPDDGQVVPTGHLPPDTPGPRGHLPAAHAGRDARAARGVGGGPAGHSAGGHLREAANRKW